MNDGRKVVRIRELESKYSASPAGKQGYKWKMIRNPAAEDWTVIRDLLVGFSAYQTERLQSCSPLLENEGSNGIGVFNRYSQ